MDKSCFPSNAIMRPALDWVVGYEATLFTAVDDSTQRVNLSHGFLKGEARVSSVNFCWYAGNGSATDASISYNIEELPFLKTTIALALAKGEEIRVEQLHGNRMITVRSFVPPTSASVIDMSLVFFGYRDHHESKQFTVDFPTASKVLEELDRIIFITRSLQDNELFERALAIILMKAINPSWKEYADGWGEHMLADGNEVGLHFADRINFASIKIRARMKRICLAFALRQELLLTHCDIVTIVDAFVMGVEQKLWKDEPAWRHFCHISNIE